MPKLRLHSPASIPGLGSILDIPGDDVTVGRAPDNQLVIPENSVSLRHARLQRKAKTWVLTDLGNTNGIWVGVKRVTEHELRPGQLFRIGGVALEFVDDSTNLPGMQNGPPSSRGAPAAEAALDSAIRRQFSPEVDDKTLVDAPAESTSRLDSSQSKRNSESISTSVAHTSYGIQQTAAGILALIVLGFAITFGGYFALRWMSKVHQGVTAPPAIVRSASLTKVNDPVAAPPQALLSDTTVANVAEEQRVDIPNLLSLVLPPGALHTPTHLVVARASRQGSLFCDTTQYAGTVFEVATSYNHVWAHPATLELPVDVDQLAKTRVSSLAIGLLDQTKQEWQLLPTEYDSTRKIAKAQFWQPGLLALFFVTGPEQIATSEHFALLIEPDSSSTNPVKSERDRAAKALGQMESTFSHFRNAGYRVPTGSLWICATTTNIRRSLAFLPVVRRSELSRSSSHGLARAVFAALMPAYMNSHSVDGREFWFDAMLNAEASHALGLRVAGNVPKIKRLSSALVAEDWPAPPLLMSLLARIVDPQLDLYRIWTDTTHVMNELDTKVVAEGQSPVLPIELALQQETQKSLLEHYSEFVKERLLAAPGAGAESADERCPSLTSMTVNIKSGTVKRQMCQDNTQPAGPACHWMYLPENTATFGSN